MAPATKLIDTDTTHRHSTGVTTARSTVHARLHLDPHCGVQYEVPCTTETLRDPYMVPHAYTSRSRLRPPYATRGMCTSREACLLSRTVGGAMLNYEHDEFALFLLVVTSDS